VRQPKSEHFQGNLRKVSENKNKTNFLINLLFQIFLSVVILLLLLLFSNPKIHRPVSFTILHPQPLCIFLAQYPYRYCQKPVMQMT